MAITDYNDNYQDYINPQQGQQAYGGNSGGGWQQALGGMMPGIGNLFGSIMGYNSWQNPMDAAMPYLDQIEGKMKPYYQPYVDAGNQAMGALMPQYQNLINNPTGLMNQILGSYQDSPAYKYDVQEATKGANSVAAAGGMLGSPAEQYSLAQNISGLANHYQDQYLQNALGQYNTGLNGMGNMANLGYNASNELATNLAQALMSQSKLAYAGANAANQNSGGFLGGLGELGGDLAGAALSFGLF